jgi:succinate dehydrogenase assembly factor 1
MVRTKSLDKQDKFRLYVRYQFKNQATSVSPRDLNAVEHLIRKGRRQLETYESPAVKDCWVSQQMREWDAQDRSRGTQ